MTSVSSIEIWAPRWRDRTVLIADWKIANGKNKVIITAKRKDGSLYFPLPFLADGKWLRRFPITPAKMRVVPLDGLETEDAVDMDTSDICNEHNMIKLTHNGLCPKCYDRERGENNG